MSGRLGIPLAKEARALLESVTSSSQKKGKRKRLPDTRVVDDPEAYKLSRAKAAVAPAKVETPSTVFAEPSPAKSAKKKKSSES